MSSRAASPSKTSSQGLGFGAGSADHGLFGVSRRRSASNSARSRASSAIGPGAYVRGTWPQKSSRDHSIVSCEIWTLRFEMRVSSNRKVASPLRVPLLISSTTTYGKDARDIP